MPFIILSVVIQVTLVLHVVKTGRNISWLYIIVLLPLAGSVAYFIVELLPDIAGSRAGRKTSQKLTNFINPNKDLNKAAAKYSQADSIENSKNLANECLQKEMFEEAKILYQKCLHGLYEFDPSLMHGLAESEYGLGNYTEVKTLLDDLIAHNPDYKNPNAHLLYAKTLEQLGEVESAIEEYEVLDSYFSGPEPTYRLAILLKKNGQQQKAKQLLHKIINQSDISGGHYNRLHKNWIKLAKSEFHR